MAAEPAAPDAQELELKMRLRAFFKDWAFFALTFLCAAAAFIASMQAALSAGRLTRLGYWTPLLLLAAPTVILLRRGRWVLAAVCCVWMVLAAFYLPKVGELAQRRIPSASGPAKP